MSFLPFHLGADTQSQGRVGMWVRSWWRTSDQAPGPGRDRNWGGLPLVEIGQDNMFDLKDVKAARLWMLPPAAMEVAIELLWEDKLAHPLWPHVLVVPRFMTHLWRRNLGRTADVLFTIPAGVPFWGSAQFEPLIVAIVFPLAHVSSYTGPWTVKGTDMGCTTSGPLRRGSESPPLDHPPRSQDSRDHRGEEYSMQAGRQGVGRTQDNYMMWTGHCLECSTIWKRGHGLFCGNFLLARGSYHPQIRRSSMFRRATHSGSGSPGL
jgi:hypothetical protein